MRTYLIVTLLLAGLGSVPAEDAAAKSEVAPPAPAVRDTPAAPAGDSSTGGRLEVVPKGAPVPESLRLTFYLGDPLVIRATGEVAARIGEAWSRPTEPRKPRLYLDGILMSNLPMAVSESGEPGAVSVRFFLDRDANDEASRSAWDLLLGHARGWPATVRVALDLDDGLPRWVAPGEVQVSPAPEGRLNACFWGGLLAIAILFWGALAWGNLLREPGKVEPLPDGSSLGVLGPYSLGKMQMAFWGILVLVSFVGVWIACGRMERIPPQVLVLMGISGATGLSSQRIGSRKQEDARRKADALRVEAAKIEDALKDDAKGPLAKARKQTRERLLTQADAADDAARGRRTRGLRKDVLRDAFTDSKGSSLHRVQFGLWTLVLGLVFLDSVWSTLSMPEFSDTLLVLMGISSGTYVGFKIPENPE